jgi:hypothetical protein
MFINEAAIDWLTLTTWSTETWGVLEAAARGMGITTRREARRMQYRGLESGGVFWGEALQQGYKHFMVMASGMDAAILAPRVAGYGAKCTRLDLQVTVPLKRDDSRPGDLFDAMQLWPDDWWGRGGKPQLKLVTSGDLFDTLYIGNRTSDRMTRIYVKPDDAGRPYLRYEVEYKGELAQNTWQHLEDEQDPIVNMASTLEAEIDAIPAISKLLPESMLSCLRMGRPGVRPGRQTVPAGSSGLNWLTRQVQPAIMRLMADHDAGAGIRALIRAWAAEADMIDDVIDSLDIKD